MVGTHHRKTLASLLLLADLCSSVPVIDSVWPIVGSRNGATRLTISGSGFSQEKFLMTPDPNLGNYVYLVNDQQTYSCDVEEDHSTHQVIQCVTPKFQQRLILKIVVRADGVDAAENPQFLPHILSTPQIHSIYPQGLEPQSVITTQGQQFTRAYNSTGVNWPGSPACQTGCQVVQIYNKASTCSLYTNSNPLDAEEIYGFYLENDGIDSYLGGFQCRLGGSLVGNQNVTYVVNQEFGRSETVENVLRTSRLGKLYTIQTYAVVSGLSSNAGGTNGGSTLTINGRWFNSDMDYTVEPNVMKTSVNLDGVECPITFINDTMIECTIPSGEDAVGTKWYPGGRGLQTFLYNDTVMPDYIDTLDRLNTMLSADKAEAHRRVDLAGEMSFEHDNIEDLGVNYMLSAWGFFNPGEASRYTFDWAYSSPTDVFFSSNADSTYPPDIDDDKGDTLFDLEADGLYPFAFVQRKYPNTRTKPKFQPKLTWWDGGLTSHETPFAHDHVHRLDVSVDHFTEKQRVDYNNFEYDNLNTGSNSIANSDLSKIQMCYACADAACSMRLESLGRKTTEYPTSNPMLITDLQTAVNQFSFYGHVRIEDDGSNCDSGAGFNIFGADHRIELVGVAGQGTLTVTKNIVRQYNDVYPSDKLWPIWDGVVLEGGLTMTGVLNTDTDAMTDAINALTENYCPDDLTVLQLGLVGTPTKIFMDFEGDDTSCWPGIDSEDSFCGRSSIKNTESLFIAGTTKQTCSGTEQQYYPSSVYQYLCFAYKGLLEPQLLVTAYYQDIVTQEWQSREVPLVFNAITSSENAWNHVCLDLETPFRAYFDLFKSYYSGFYVQEIKVVVTRGDFWIDNVQIAKTGPVQDTVDAAIYNRVEMNIPGADSATVTSQFIGSDPSYIVDIAAANCGNGYEMLEFLWTDTTNDQTDTHGRMRHRHSSWSSSWTIDIYRLQSATVPATGKLFLHYDRIDGAVEINMASIEEGDLTNIFRGVGSIISETMITDTCYQKVWDIGIQFPGGYHNIPTYTSEVSGDNPVVLVEHQSLGRLELSNNFSPVGTGGVLGADWFRSGHHVPQISVIVNDIFAYCEDNCDYSHDSSLNPTVTNIVPKADLVSGSTVITITGTNLADATMISPRCTTLTATDNELQCTLDADVVAAEYTAQILHLTRGYADDNTRAGNPSGDSDFTMLVKPTASMVNPAAGSVAGGQTVTITGTGLGPTTDASAIDVVVAGFDCTFVSSTETELICITSNAGSAKTGGIRIADYATGVQYEYSEAMTPYVTAINPSWTNVQGGDLMTITGSNFQGASDMAVFISTFELGATLGIFKSVSSTEIIFESPPIGGTDGLTTGSYEVYVFVEGWGRSMGSDQIDYRLSLTSVSPSDGAAYGGNTAIIDGYGFVADQTTVMFGENSCEITSLTSTEVQCTVPSSGITRIITPDNVEIGGFSNDMSWDGTQSVMIGDRVQFQWDFSDEADQSLAMKICETNGKGKSACVFGGLDSGARVQKSSWVYTAAYLGTQYFTGGCVSVNNYQSATRKHLNCQGVLYADIETIERVDMSVDITVSVNVVLIGTPSEADHDGSTSLTYAYDVARSMEVTGFSPNQLGASEGVLTIDGNNFNANTKVEIGGFNCAVSSWTTTELVCSMDHSQNAEPTVAEWLQLRVFDDFGNALNRFTTENQELIIIIPEVSTVSHVEGSLAGGTRVTFTGAGFTVPGYSLTLDSDQVNEVSRDYYTLIVETPAYGTGRPLNDRERYWTMNMVALGQTASFFMNGHTTFNQRILNTLSINDIMMMQPGTDTVLSTETPIMAGANFRLFLFENYNETNSYTIMIGDAECGNKNVIINVDFSLMECTLLDTPTVSHSTDVVRMEILDTMYGDAFVDNVIREWRVDTQIDSVTPAVGGVNGGTVVTVTGRGFGSDIVPKVNGVECVTSSVERYQFVCTTSAGTGSGLTVNFFEDSGNFAYDEDVTPTITHFSPEAANQGETVTMYGSNFGTDTSKMTLDFDGSVATVTSAFDNYCTVLLPAHTGGAVNEFNLHVDNGGYGTSTGAALEYNMLVSAVSPMTLTTAGGAYMQIEGSGFEDSSTVAVCGNNAEVVSRTSNLIVAMSPEMGSQSSCTVKVTNPTTATTKQFGSQVNYDAGVTAEVTDVNVGGVSPARGGSMGGTTLTVVGRGFDCDADTVYTSGVECIVGTLFASECSSTKIVCKTEAFAIGGEFAREMNVQVHRTEGNAENDGHTFYFIDRWNSIYTWGGRDPPAEDGIVTIAAGDTVMIDGETNVLTLLIVQGGVVLFDDTRDDNVLRTKNILVTSGGRIQAGSEAEPFGTNSPLLSDPELHLGNPRPPKALIELHGKLRQLELPVYGVKSMGIRDGSLKLHGLRKIPTWTRLEATAGNGTNILSLQQPVNWSVGDEIVITTTGYQNSQIENERRYVAAVNNNGYEIELTEPLEYSHLGFTETLRNGKTVEYRAEVGVLSRNVQVKGSINDGWSTDIPACEEGFDPSPSAVMTCFAGRYGDEMGGDEFGASIMIHPKDPGTVDTPSVAIAELEQIEVQYGGQAFRVGRYPIHIHINGESEGSYVTGSAVHNGYNRAINVHETYNFEISHNVIFDIKGGALFLENGIEQNIRIIYNMASFVKTSSSLMNDDLVPATIWITHPNNECSHNAVGGSTHFGIWYRIHDHPEASSYTEDYCPNKEAFGSMTNNTVHSVSWFGLWIFPDYFPHIAVGDDTICNSTTPIKRTFTNFRAWRVGTGVEFFNSGPLTATDFIIAEAELGFEWKRLFDVDWTEEHGAFMDDITISQYSSLWDPENEPFWPRYAIIPPVTSGLYIRNVDIIGYGHNPSSAAITSPGITCTCAGGCGGFETRFENIRFFNTGRRVQAKYEHMIQIHDMDGSFTAEDQENGLKATGSRVGQESRIFTDNVLWQDHGCDLQDGELFSWDTPMTICDSNHHIFRLGINEMFPFALRKLDANVTVDGVLYTMPYRLIGVWDGSGFQMPTRSNRRMEFDFVNMNMYDDVSFKGHVTELPMGDWVIMVIPAAPMPSDTFVYCSVYPDPDYMSETGTYRAHLKTAPLDENSENGACYHNPGTKTVEFMIKNDGTDFVEAPLESDDDDTSSRKKRNAFISGYSDVYTTRFGLRARDRSVHTFEFYFSYRYCIYEWCITPEAPVIPFDGSVPDSRPDNALYTGSVGFRDGEPTQGFGTPKEPFTITEADGSPAQFQLYEDDTIIIAIEQWLVVDSTIPKLKNIIVYGGFEIGDIATFQVHSVIVLGGRFMAVQSTGSVRSEPLNLIFYADTDDAAIRIGEVAFGQSGIACFGTCEFAGNGYQNSWTLLSVDAPAGAQILTVEDYICDWPVGAKMVLASTSMDGTQTEDSLVLSSVYTDDCKRIRLVTGLTYAHRGTETDINMNSFRAELAIITRDIVFASHEDVLNHGIGAHFLSGQAAIYSTTTGTYSNYIGSLTMDNIQVNYAGQSNFANKADPRWAWVVNCPTETCTATDEKPLRLTNCAFYRGFGPGVGIFRAQHVTIQGNVFHRPAHGGIWVDGYSNFINIIENVVMDVMHINSFGNEYLNTDNLQIVEYYWPGGISFQESHSAYDVMYGNRVAGSEMVGIRYQGHTCSQASSRYYHSNTVRGATFGYVWRGYEQSFYNAAAMWGKGRLYDRCAIVDGLDISQSAGYGILVLMVGGDAKLTIQNSRVANSYHAGLYMVASKLTHLPDHNHYHNQLKLQDSYLNGHTPEFDCNTEMFDRNGPRYNSAGMTAYLSFTQSTSFNLVRQARSGQSYKIPEMEEPFDGIKLWPINRVNMLLSQVTMRYSGTTCESDKPGYAIILDNGNIVDHFAPVFLERIKLYDVGALTYYQDPSIEHITATRCVDLECDVWTTNLIVDMDGSFLNSGVASGRGAILPDRTKYWNDPGSRGGPLDDRIPKTALTDLDGNVQDVADNFPNKGRPINPGACRHNADYNAIVCNGVAAGVYMYLIIENMDHDTKDRRLSPLAILTNRGDGGYVDLYNGPSMMNWGKRLGQFQTTVIADSHVEVFCTASPPKHLRVQLNSGFDNANGQNKILAKFYNPLPQKLEVKKCDLDQVAESDPDNNYSTLLAPSNCPTADEHTEHVTLSHSAGKYFQDRDEQLLYLVMADTEHSYDITVTDQVVMAFGFPSVPAADFFEDNLINNIANFYGIDPSKIYVVEVIREDSLVSGRRKRGTRDLAWYKRTKRSGLGDIVGIKFEVNPGTPEEIEAASQKTTELADAMQDGNVATIAEVTSNTGVSAETLQLDELASIPPDSSDEEAFEAFQTSISQKIEEGKANVAPPVVRIDSIVLEFDIPSDGSAKFLEGNSFSPAPRLYFLDANGNRAESVGTFDAPWYIQATLHNGAGYQSLTGNTRIPVVNGNATFNDLRVNYEMVGTPDRKYTITFATEGRAHLAQTSNEFQVRSTETIIERDCETDWQCMDQSQPPFRINNMGDAECMANIGACVEIGGVYKECKDALKVITDGHPYLSLACGDEYSYHQGHNGYDRSPSHWCNQVLQNLGRNTCKPCDKTYCSHACFEDGGVARCACPYGFEFTSYSDSTCGAIVYDSSR